MRGNTIFLTGGTSGIGKGFAEAFHERGNQMIVTGRREERLKELCREHPGMRYFVLDVTDADAIRRVARQTIAEFPEINCVINNAGVQMGLGFAAGSGLDDQALVAEIHTNLLGVIRVTAAFLEHLRARPGATLINVSSGLAFVPMARFPVYCATKAAVHSWTLSLRHQLRGSGVEVIELIPPYVATDLGGPGKSVPGPGSERGPMPLDTFIAETMKELETGAEDVAIGPAKNLVAAAGADTVKQAFSRMNE
jgi:uncharacterized oxidoreductase